MNNWRKYKLGELASEEKGAIKSGPFGSNIGSRFFVECGVPVIRGNNLTIESEKFKDDGFVFLTEEKAAELNCWAVKDDLIFTAAGTIGQVGLLTGKEKYKRYVISNKQIKVSVNKKLINPLYAYYWFSSPQMIEYIKNNNTGSTIPLINLAVIKSLPIDLPDLQTQSRIASILSSLDDKIELNRRMNQTLEQMAQALFNHYFVDNIDPDNLPKGWTQKSIREVVSVKDGTHDSPKPKEYGYYLITSKHIKGSKIDFNQAYFISEKDYIDVNRRSKVDTYDILLTMIGTVGVVHLVTENPVNFAIKNIGLFKSSERTDLFEFIYLYLSSKRIKDYLETRTTGSTQQYLTLQTLRNIPITIPTDSVLKDFKSEAHSLIMKIRSNDDEVVLLTKIRDILLPKLMSGEIDVEALMKEEEQRIENLETA